MKFFSSIALVYFLVPVLGMAQPEDVNFEKVSTNDFTIRKYDMDTSAVAIVLREFGQAYIDTDKTYDLIVQYHVRIKILKQGGVSKSDVSIPLRKSDGKAEKLNVVKASSFNLVDGAVIETKLKTSDVFLEELDKFYEYKKFAIPNVRVGSIIDYAYEVQSPFIFNFFPWVFQDNIPKLLSEYWAKIPGNYVYNISIRGPLTPSRNENYIIPKCVVVTGDSYGSGTYADCIQYKFAMNNIPPFVEEEYMTAKSNFLSAINFELAEVRDFTGKVDKITKEWRDVDKELRLHKDFGLQIKRGKDLMEEHLKEVIADETDSLTVAKKLYDFIKFRYDWNNVYGKYSELGIKEAFEKRKGNIGDINLSLVAALKYAGFAADPVILSTRENGQPVELYPVLSDFNYVIAKLTLGGKIFLLDATDDFLPFGMIPLRCINGKGRVLESKQSYWIDIKPSDKARRVSMYTLTLSPDGLVKGSIQRSYFGYQALAKRKSIFSLPNQSAYAKELEKELSLLSISNVELLNVEDLSKPVIEKFEIELNDFQQSDAMNFLFNPFITNKQGHNPFKSNERLYPVDFGAPIEELLVLSMEYADNFKVSSLPGKVAIALPQNGGRYICDFQTMGNRVTVNQNLVISKTVYSPDEYHYLKALYSQVVQTQNADLLFTKN